MVEARRIDRAARIAALSPDARAEVLDFLDDVSRPLSRREVEKLLGPFLTRKDRERIVPLLLQVHLIAILPIAGASAAS